MSTLCARGPLRRALIAAPLAVLFVLGLTPATLAGAQEPGPPPPLGAVFDGQSNTLSPSIGEGYPMQLMQRTMPGVPFAVVAEGATSYAARTSTAGERVDSLAPLVDHAVLFTEGGPNDIIVDGLAAPQVIERIRTYVAGRRAAGFDTVVSSTILPATVFGDRDHVRLEVNQLLREQHRELGIDVLVDLAAVRYLQYPLSRTFYLDGIHLTRRGAYGVALAHEEALRAAGYVQCRSFLLFRSCSWTGPT